MKVREESGVNSNCQVVLRTINMETVWSTRIAGYLALSSIDRIYVYIYGRRRREVSAATVADCTILHTQNRLRTSSYSPTESTYVSPPVGWKEDIPIHSNRQHVKSTQNLFSIIGIRRQHLNHGCQVIPWQTPTCQDAQRNALHGFMASIACTPTIRHRRDMAWCYRLIKSTFLPLIRNQASFNYSLIPFPY